MSIIRSSICGMIIILIGVTFNPIFAQTEDNTDFLFEEGKEYYNDRKYRDAISIFDKVLEINPEHLDSLIYKGKALYEIVSFKESTLPYLDALKIDQNNIDSLIGMGKSTLKIGTPAIAKNYFDRVLLIDSNNQEASEGKKLAEAVMKTDQEEDGGCLIATAAYGTELAPQVQFLREIRDNELMNTSYGVSFMTGFNQFYYSFSPTIADWEKTKSSISRIY